MLLYSAWLVAHLENEYDCARDGKISECTNARSLFVSLMPADVDTQKQFKRENNKKQLKMWNCNAECCLFRCFVWLECDENENRTSKTENKKNPTDKYGIGAVIGSTREHSP